MNGLEDAKNIAANLFAIGEKKDSPPDPSVVQHLYGLVTKLVGLPPGSGAPATIHYYFDEELEMTVKHKPDPGWILTGRILVGKVCIVQCELATVQVLQYHLALQDSLRTPIYLVKEQYSIDKERLVQAARGEIEDDNFWPSPPTQNVYGTEAGYLENFLSCKPEAKP